MGVKTQRHEARRTAREARSGREEQRKAREKRLEDLAVTALVAVEKAADQERLAGEALRVMTDDEGLSTREAVAWCGEAITVREAARLKRLVDQDEQGEGGAGDKDDDGKDGSEGWPGQAGEPLVRPERASA